MKLRDEKVGDRFGDYDYLLKFLVVGDSCVGKPIFLLRLGEEISNYAATSTIGIDFKIKTPYVLNPVVFPVVSQDSTEEVGIRGEGEEGAKNISAVTTVSATATEDIGNDVPAVAVAIAKHHTDDPAAAKVAADKTSRSIAQDQVLELAMARRIFKVKCQIWDTARPERVPITPSYFRKCMGIYVLYDISERSSFESITSWINRIQQHAPPDVKVILIGCKDKLDNNAVNHTIQLKQNATTETMKSVCDLDVQEDGESTRLPRTRQVTFEEGVALTRRFPIISAFLEVNSRENYQVQDAFSTMICLTLKKRLLARNSPRVPPPATPTAGKKSGVNGGGKCVMS
jgi:GTPase SAR1 family protein